MKLTSQEERVIKRFKERIESKFGDEIVEIIVYGSKARGDADKNSDIDILVVTLSEDWRLGDRIRETGYDLDEDIDYRLSIQVVPKSHIVYLRENGFQFIKSVDLDGIRI